MLTTIKDIVRLCIRSITPTIVIGAETNDTSKSAVHNASSSGFFTRAVDCEQSEMRSVELPQMPLNTTIPYNIINISNESELSSSLLASYSKTSLSIEAFNVGYCVAVLPFVIIVTFREAFLNCESFKSHCLSSILHQHANCGTKICAQTQQRVVNFCKKKKIKSEN
jgi:hypothetical protein